MFPFPANTDSKHICKIIYVDSYKCIYIRQRFIETNTPEDIATKFEPWMFAGPVDSVVISVREGGSK